MKLKAFFAFLLFALLVSIACGAFGESNLPPQTNSVTVIPITGITVTDAPGAAGAFFHFLLPAITPGEWLQTGIVAHLLARIIRNTALKDSATGNGWRSTISSLIGYLAGKPIPAAKS